MTGPVQAGTAHGVTYDRYSLMVDGRRLILQSAEFHYFRLPGPALWRDVLEKLKAAGFNAESTGGGFPAGVLDEHGTNTLALAVTAEQPVPGPGPIDLFAYANVRTTR
ncbi:beta-galactosidase [Nonomuraea jiangxiensis]|nr:beta-galactosidase [Nonomuraea jiangxiensis]